MSFKTNQPVIHLQQGGLIALATVGKDGPNNKSKIFYRSPQNKHSPLKQLNDFYKDSPKEKLIVNIVPDFPSVQMAEGKSLKNPMGKVNGVKPRELSVVSIPLGSTVINCALKKKEADSNS